MLDEMGDRMKSYERTETGRRFDPELPLYARLDGRGFSKFTKGLVKPFDPTMSDLMVDVTKFLVKETGAVTGYVQSDEISLFWKSCDDKSEFIFGGKAFKLHSILAAMATAYFNREVVTKWDAPHRDRIAMFDARVCQVPEEYEITNMFLWRYKDAVRNAVSTACHHNGLKKAVFKKSHGEKLEMLAEKGVDFSSYPDAFKYGTFVKRFDVYRNGVARREALSCHPKTPFHEMSHDERNLFIYK